MIKKTKKADQEQPEVNAISETSDQKQPKKPEFITKTGHDPKNRIVTMTGTKNYLVIKKPETGFKASAKTLKKALEIFNEQLNSSQNL